MRLLAVLVLLLQLQPLVGSVLCFHDAEVANAECTMPHEGQPAGSTLTASESGVPGGCPGMVYCAATAPGIPKVAEHLQITSSVHGAPALTDASMALGDGPAPPFDPPRA